MTPHDLPPHDDPIARLMRELPEDTPSRDWRTGLDLGVKRIHRRRQVVRAVSQITPVVALAVMAGAFLRPAPPTPPAKAAPNLGSALVATHREISAMPSMLDPAGGGEIAPDPDDIYDGF